MAPFGLIELKDGNILVFGGEDKAEVVKEQPVPEYLTTSFGILGQLDKNF